jgi:hypothetical protein
MTAEQKLNYAKLILSLLTSPAKLRLQRQTQLAARDLAGVLSRVMAHLNARKSFGDLKVSSTLFSRRRLVMGLGVLTVGILLFLSYKFVCQIRPVEITVATQGPVPKWLLAALNARPRPSQQIMTEFVPYDVAHDKVVTREGYTGNPAAYGLGNIFPYNPSTSRSTAQLRWSR